MPRRRPNSRRLPLVAPPQIRRGARLMFMALGAVQSGSIAGMVTAAAGRYGVDPGLALAVAQRESSLNPNAVSSAGAMGVMQLMPATAAQFGVVNPYDPAQNINAGVQYLAQLLGQYGGDVAKAVAAYDWGPGNLDRAISANGDGWLAVAPQETQSYVAALTGITPADLQPAEAAAPDASTFVIDPSTGYLVPDTGDTGDGTAVDASGLSTGELLALTGLGVGAYLLVRLLD